MRGVQPTHLTARPRALAQLALKPALKHRLYNVSAGRSARTFGEVCSAITARHPEIGRIHGIGRHRKVAGRGRGRLMKPLEAYLPFINAGVRYANDRAWLPAQCRVAAPREFAVVFPARVSIFLLLAGYHQPVFRDVDIHVAGRDARQLRAVLL